MGHERILLVRGDGIGDSVLGSGFMAGLRESRPEAHITLALRAGLEQLFDGCPYVDQVEVFTRGARCYSEAVLTDTVLSIARAMSSDALRGSPFDLVVDLHSGNTLHDSMPVTALVPARRRLGAPMGSADDAALMHKFYDDVIDLRPCHEVVRYAALSCHLGAEPREPALWDSGEHRERALRVLGQDESWWASPKVFIGVGASTTRRRWPADRFAVIAGRLAARDVDVVVLGSSDEAPAVHQVASSAGPHGFAAPGLLAPLEVSALFRGGGIFLGNDSGPVHVAAAAGLPVVQITMHPRSGDSEFPGSPERYGPWGVPFVLAQPDNLRPGCRTTCSSPEEVPHCILQVDVEQVWDALLTFASFT